MSLQWPGDRVTSLRCKGLCPETYLGVAKVFDVTLEEVMLVAAHHDDLAGDRACGLRTAYIERPMEYGPTHAKDVSPIYIRLRYLNFVEFCSCI
jgi:FMN phosphatase YigB (HAD superfamily)